MAKPAFETTRFERLSYGGFFFGQNIIYLIQFQFLAYFYTEGLGITAQSASLLLLIVRLWDAVNDPIMGAILDKSSFKGGKYLPWLRVVTYAIPLLLVLMFLPVGEGYGIKLAFAYVTYILFDIAYTVSDAPLFSLSTVMAHSIYERDKLLASGRFAAALAAIATALFMTIKARGGWTLATGVYALLAFVCMFPLQFAAKERVKHVHSGDITFKKVMRFLFKNKYLLIYYAGYLAINATNSLQLMAAYFARFNLGDEGLVTLILAVTVVPVLIAAPLLPRLISRFGKRRLTVVCSIVAVVLSVGQYFIGYSNLVVFLAVAAVRVVFMQIPLLIYGMFTADCIEYGAHINGEHTEGIAFSIQTLMTKLGGALCSLIVLQVMSWSGYVEQAQTQTQGTLDAIWLLLCILPAAGYLGMLVAMRFYDLSEARVKEIMDKMYAGRERA